MIKNLLLVGAGGALGSIARYSVSLLFAHFAICSHWATLVVNVVGSLLIGLAIPLLSGGAHLIAVVGSAVVSPLSPPSPHRQCSCSRLASGLLLQPMLRCRLSFQ